MITVKTYDEPPFREKEILRYAGCCEPNEETLSLLQACLNEIRQKLSYKVCFCEQTVSIEKNTCYFRDFSLHSVDLARNLDGCEKVLLLGATIGIEIDRLITRYGRLSPAKALLFQAIGAERIEALCDAFCADYETTHGVALRSRFSPGYGDLPLKTQTTFFEILDCNRKIGLCLNNSMLMSPSKSVTAFIGVDKNDCKKQEKNCCLCDKKDCLFRSI